MKGFDEFLAMFGDITILQVAEFILAATFCIWVYYKVKKYFNHKSAEELERKEIERQRDADLKEALTSVRKYPESRSPTVLVF